MTAAQRVISALIVAHLAALSIGAVPDSVGWLAMVRPPVDAYLRATAQRQAWVMFVNPAHVGHFVRLGYRLRRADGTSTVEYETVLPVIDPGRWKLVDAYFNSFTNKAFSAVTGNYQERRNLARTAGELVPTVEMTRGLQPVTRYYARRRIAAGLPTGASLEAVEFWWGTADFAAWHSAPRVDELDAAGLIDWQLWWADDLR
jgi:hypothetical protein